MKNQTPEAEVTPAKERILIVHECLPQFDRCESGMRVLQVLRLLRQMGHPVTYVGRNAAGRERYEPVLREIGIEVYAGDRVSLHALGVEASPSAWRLHDVLHSEAFDIAILCQWFWSGISVTEQYLDLIRRESPATKVIVLTDHRHGERERRLAQLRGLASDAERAANFEQRELECYRLADLVLAISEDDRRALWKLDCNLKIELLGVSARAEAGGPGYAERRDLLFLGDDNQPGNRDALQWLLAEIWPQLRHSLPGVQLHLAGNNMPQVTPEAEGVVSIGQVADLGATLARYRVFVSPIRFGTGIKTKNLAALSHGLPLVTTAVGAEGMELTGGVNALIADSGAKFAAAVVRVYGDAELWQSLAAQGRAHVEQHFSVQRAREHLEKALRILRNTTPAQFDANHRWSVRIVEEVEPKTCDLALPALDSACLRIAAYAQYAKQLLAQGRAREACEQLRHIFAFASDPFPLPALFPEILTLLARCYRELGETDRAARYGHEARLAAFDLRSKRGSAPARQGRAERAPQFSVIVPTYNRAPVLRECLQALDGQSLDPAEFEVIVVDDGSTDATGQVLQEATPKYVLQHLHQPNAGIGAARRQGVQQAKGRYLLLINDDTIAAPGLLAEHLRVQEAYAEHKVAVLGSFHYPPAARRRALTQFLATTSFMFPQNSMSAGADYDCSQLVTCNLSVSRAAVVAAGSFTGRLPVGEDTELGFRLRKQGCRVLFHPEAHAWHRHLEVTVPSLVSRACQYGPVYLYLLRKYSELRPLMPVPFTDMQAGDKRGIVEYLEQRRSEIGPAVSALAKYDAVDFEPYYELNWDGRPAAAVILELFAAALPRVYWFYVYESLLRAWERESGDSAGGLAWTPQSPVALASPNPAGA